MRMTLYVWGSAPSAHRCPTNRRLAAPTLLLLLASLLRDADSEPTLAAGAASVSGLALAAATAGPVTHDTAAGALQRRLQLNFAGLVHDHSDIHVRYEFTLTRQNMRRQGVGELWVSFDPSEGPTGGLPKIRLRGAAHSPRFGAGEITVVVDPKTKLLHALFKLGELHEAQCVTYAFPRIEASGNAKRLELMRWRRDQVRRWENVGSSTGWKELSPVNWTKSTVLAFDLSSDGKSVQGLTLRKGSHAVKTVQLVDGSSAAGDLAPGGLFDPPAPTCAFEKNVDDPMAHLQLKPPHRRSSALNDLLLTLVDHEANSEAWPRLFLVLCTLAIPGDVAVMIEDPKPPSPGKFGTVFFDYTAEVISHGIKHTSEGSIWLNAVERAFRLRGEAAKTKVGPLYMDLIARGGHDDQVYANVNLTVQEEQQCVTYAYPKLNPNSSSELKSIAAQGLAFYAIAELNGEDCGIFVAPLARGRWIHIWVDLESDNPDAILRSEIHRGGMVIRSTDIRNWHAGHDIAVSMSPLPEWGCTANPAGGQLAHLGLSQVHKRSIELQDTLYAVHDLDSDFAVLEVLGLTGDVAIMVQEPELPELWKLPAVSYSYSLWLIPVEQKASTIGRAWTSGTFAADVHRGRVRMTASDATSVVSIALEPGVLAVRVEEFPLPPVCLTLPIEGASKVGNVSDTANLPLAAAGIFDGVEPVGDTVCNRFTFLGTGIHAESVELWYSKEEDALCRLSVKPPPKPGGGGVGARINVPSWETAYLPGGPISKQGATAIPQQAHLAGLAEAPEGWNCQPVVGQTWLSLAMDVPQDALATGIAIAKLAEASGVVGLLSPKAANYLSRLIVLPPSSVTTTTPAPKVDILGPDLKTFAFSYASMFPLQGIPGSPGGISGPGAPLGSGLRNRGTGEVRADLARRRLYLRSKAINVSAGIPEAESRVIFRGDRGRLYVYSRLGDDFEECWSVNTVEAVPAPAGGEQPNPFQRGKSVAEHFSVPGLEGSPAQKYVFDLNPNKRVQFFVEESTLVAINIDDLRLGVSAGVLIHDWSTAPIAEEWFQPNEEFHCEDMVFDEEAERLADWDLIQVFFPGNVRAPLATSGVVTERRLFS